MSMELHSRSSVRDSTFFFRIRRRAGTEKDESELKVSTSNGAAEDQQGSQYDAAAFLYGFVFCRQRSDERLKRGGEQKSVVVLSSQPYSAVLTPLSQHAGPLYFNRGNAALQEVYQEVQAWEAPSPGLRGMVMLGTMTLPAQVPAPATLPAALPPSDAEHLEHPLAPLPVVRQANGCNTIQGTFFEADVWSTLKEVVERAWVLWELMILAQPLLVLAPSPGVCSAAVAALVALITPLPYSADFRPYFTIHDPAFAHLASQQLPTNANSLPRLLGVTNLFFLKVAPDPLPAKAASAAATT